MEINSVSLDEMRIEIETPEEQFDEEKELLEEEVGEIFERTILSGSVD